MSETPGTAVEQHLLPWLSALGGPGDIGVSDAARIDQLRALETVKAAAAAAQARITAAFVASQEQVAKEWQATADAASAEGDFGRWVAARDAARAASVGDLAAEASGRRGRRAAGRSAGRGSGRERVGTVAQLALARRVSPSRGARMVATALALVDDLPHTLDALTAGRLSERRAEIVASLTSCLTPEQRRQVDADLAPELADPGPRGAGAMGDRELTRRVTHLVYRVDPAGAVDRARSAEGDRRVTLRPAPDTMTYLTALLPVAQGVAVHAALTQAADTARAAGDPRSKGAVMADTLTARVTGRERADDVPLELQVVITDRALLGADQTPAQVPGYGTVPAEWARDLAKDAGTAWVRRLFTHPDTGTLVAMDSTRRVFDGGLRRFLVGRDGTCRTPWCDAPIRHLDHVTPWAAGGATTADNGQGLCVRCNLTKEAPGWTAETVRQPGAPHTVVITTPTGHSYRSTAPPVIPGPPDLPPSEDGWPDYPEDYWDDAYFEGALGQCRALEAVA